MTESQILKLIPVTEAITMNAIAKKLDMEKASAELKSTVNKLVNDGLVQMNTDGRYVTYQKISTSAVAKTEKKDAPVAVAGKTSASLIEAPGQTVGSLPEVNEEQVAGYRIKKIVENGKDKIRITLPNGKVLKIDPDANLLVINGEPVYVVKTAKDVVSSIRDYTVTKGMKTFTVDDIGENKKIGNENDVSVSDSHIMFVTIQKHNKAAIID